MIHLYGLVQELEELPSLVGIDGAPLERWRTDEFDLVVSRSTGQASEISEEAVLAHANVVEELMGLSRAVLPARFGRAFASEEELRDAVRAKASGLGRGLTRVRDCAEFGLRALAPERAQADLEGSSGREYMRARLAETTERARLADELHEPLAALSRASVRFAGAAGDLVHAAYLVREANAGAFRERVRALETIHPALVLVCTGPWPPYTFAGEGEHAA